MNNKEKKEGYRSSLGVLINRCVVLMEGGHVLNLLATEAAIMDGKAIELLQREYAGTIDLVVFSPKVDTWVEECKTVNEELRGYAISEYNSSQPGKSASKWGVRKNGLAYLVALAGELLASS